MTLYEIFRVKPKDFHDLHITRGSLCLAIIAKYKEDNHIHPLKKLDEHEILYSGNLAIAMEYLGMLSEGMKVYAQSRGGCIDVGKEHMSLRDYMKTIP